MTTPRLLRMPDQFTPGRMDVVAATPTCSCCCCCCCCVASVVSSAVVLPVSAARATADAQTVAASPGGARRAFGLALLTLTAPLAVLTVIALSQVARLSALNDGGIGIALVAAVGTAVAFAGDALIGRSPVGRSALLWLLFLGLIVLELVAALALLAAGVWWLYLVLVPVALVAGLGLYFRRRPGAGHGGVAPPPAG
ncbi:MAG TPA: hypothetical protein VGD67_05060 [Pseudonocardiaceae bacterium]